MELIGMVDVLDDGGPEGAVHRAGHQVRAVETNVLAFCTMDAERLISL
jgi:hypothetical protein